MIKHHDLTELERAEKWWALSPDEFKVAVFRMFWASDIIAYNPNSRTAVGEK